jgi:hypothetical protein
VPTAAKLVSAALFALIGWMAALAAVPFLPEGTNPGKLPLVSAVIGMICGWIVLGGSVGKGINISFGHGIRTAVTIYFWVLMAFGIREMFIKSTKLMYDGALDAVIGMFENMIRYAQMTLAWPVVGTLLIGGALAGIAAEIANRRWN